MIATGDHRIPRRFAAEQLPHRMVRPTESLVTVLVIKTAFSILLQRL
jgi:hypothetical protein